MREIRVAMLGFGGIAKSHKRAYERFEKEGTPIRLVAICDIDPEQFHRVAQTNLESAKPYKMEGIALYTDLEEMLAKEDFEMIDICLPSYLHKEYSIRMMERGKHVMCEKPMALNEKDCEEVLEVAKKYGKKLMIGQCLRFEPCYVYLKEQIDNGSFGKLYYMHMDRLSPLPLWGYDNWFCDTERSGGAAMDLHIHDIDMARFLFGEPKAVSASACNEVTRWQYISSHLYYDGFFVDAQGSWMESDSFSFRFGFRACFEKAEVVLEAGKMTVHPRGGEAYEVELPKKNRMAEEIRLLAESIADENVVNTVNTPEGAAKSVALVQRLCESADRGGEMIIL